MQGQLQTHLKTRGSKGRHPESGLHTVNVYATSPVDYDKPEFFCCCCCGLARRVTIGNSLMSSGLWPKLSLKSSSFCLPGAETTEMWHCTVGELIFKFSVLPKLTLKIHTAWPEHSRPNSDFRGCYLQRGRAHACQMLPTMVQVDLSFYLNSNFRVTKTVLRSWHFGLERWCCG